MTTTPTPNAALPTILLAEDELILRALTAEVLIDAGYNVVEASDGVVGLEVLQSDTKIDLLLSDIRMPRMNGYQLAEAGLALRRDLKVILVTGYASEPLPETLKPAVCQVLHKPYDLKKLPSFVADVLNN